MSLLVRAAVGADLSAILSLYTETGLDGGEPLSLERAGAIFTRMAAYPDYGVFVAEEDGRVVGTFALLIMDNLANWGAPSAIVEDVAVAVDQQGRGVGKRMMLVARARAEERGCYKLVLSSNARREAAHRFYESLGFERHGFSFQVTLSRPP